MGYAIIKGGLMEYALNRQSQSLTPINITYRKNIVNSRIACTYGDPVNGIYKVTSINLEDATQPYEYALVDSTGAAKTYTGVSIHKYNGTITTTSGYSGETVYVRIVPKTVPEYYDTAIMTDPFVAIEAHTIYTIVASYGGSVGFTAAAHEHISIGDSNSVFQIKSGSTVITSNVNDVEGLTIVSKPAWVSGTAKDITISANTSSSVRSGEINLSCTYNGQTVTGKATILQAKDELQSITFKSYNGSTTTPINVDKGTTVSASSFKVSGSYASGKSNVELTPTYISTNYNSGYATSVNITSAGSIYLKAGSVVSSAISVTVNSVTSITATSNTDNYVFVNQILNTSDFTVYDQTGERVNSFTISPTSFNSAGSNKTVTITVDGTASTTVSLTAVASTDTIELQGSTLKQGPSGSSAVPKPETNAHHLFQELDGTYKNGDIIIMKVNAPSNSRIMESTQAVINGSGNYTATGSAAPAGFLNYICDGLPLNSTFKYIVGESFGYGNAGASTDNIHLTFFAYFTSTPYTASIQYAKIN